MKMPRKDAYIFIVASTLILGVLFLDEDRLGFGTLGVVITTIFLGLGLLLGLLNLLSDEFWVYGVEIREDGFIFHQQLRKLKFIRYSSIYHIVVTAFIDSGGDSSCTVLVKSTDGNARLEESLIYETEILDALMRLPGFRHEAWSKSDVPENSLTWATIAKKTVVFDSRGY